MARELFGIEKGIQLLAENTNAGVKLLFGAGAPTLEAEVGSKYSDTSSGSQYQKIAVGTGADKWVKLATSADLLGISFRSEIVRAATGDAAPASGTAIDLVVNPFGDDETSKLVAADFLAGEYIIFGVGGTPKLMKVSLVSGDEITVINPEDELANNDNFVVRNYLPDSPADQEGSAIVNYNGSAIVKLGDINWSLATGINLSGSYVAASGNPAAADSVEAAIAKLDYNVDAVNSSLGTAQGALNMGVFTGTVLTDNTTVKANLQELGTQVDTNVTNISNLVTLSGVAANEPDLGAFTGTTIPDDSTIKGALQALETAVEAANSQVVYSSASAIGATAVMLDEVLVDDILAAEWLLTIQLDANPAQRISMKVIAQHDGTVSADAVNVDDAVYGKLKLGSNFTHAVSVELSGTGASQKMQLKIAGAAAAGVVSARASRIAVYL